MATELIDYLNSLGVDSTPDGAGDYLLGVDGGTGLLKRVDPSDLSGGGGGVSGGNIPSLASYASLSAAVAAIGSTECLLMIDEDQNVAAPTTVPANIRLVPAGGTLTKTSTGAIDFDGIGLSDPASQAPMFSGFAAGDITWTGTAWPARISSNLWSDANWSARLKNAIGGFTSKDVTIDVYPGGTLASQITVTEQKHIHFNAGTYENDAAFSYQFVLNDNTAITGDGMYRTFLKESSVAGNVRLMYASGMISNPFEGANENISVSDICVLGQSTQTYDSVSSAIELGNVRNGYIDRVYFDYVHGFAAYFGAFGSAGNYPDGWGIRDCVIRGISTQGIGCISGVNGQITGNQFLDIQPSPSGAFVAAIDLEPNGEYDMQQNITITGNIFDGRYAQNSWSAIVVQSADCPNAAGNIVADNTIIGAEAKVWYFLPAGISTAADTITLPFHKLVSGQRVYAHTVSGSMPPGLAEGFKWVTFIDEDTVKLSSSYANYLAGTFENITAAGTGSYKLSPVSFLINGVVMSGQNASTCKNNLVIGGSQQAYLFENCEFVSASGNEALQVGQSTEAFLVHGCANSKFVHNTIKTSSVTISQATTVLESEIAQTVTTATTGKLVTITGGTTARALPFWIGKTVTINSVDYVVDRVVDTTHFTVTTDPGNQTGVALATKFSSNKYVNNEWGTHTLSSTGTSVVNYIDSTGNLVVPEGKGVKSGGVTLVRYDNTGAWVGLNTADGSTAAVSQARILGNTYLGNISTPTLVTDTGQLILASKTAPASAAATGTAGEIRWDASFIYLCTAANTWKRVAIATW